MKIAILDALTFGETSLEGFNTLGEVDIYATTSPDELLDRVKDADVIVTNKVVITDETMATCKNLKLIAIAATGMNNVDLQAAKRRDIAVKNVANYSTDSVVQHTFSMLFYLMAHSKYYDGFVKEGSWSKSGIFTHVGAPFYELRGKKWGIVGLGAIGKKVATLAEAFGAEVSYYSTSGKNHDRDFQSTTFSKLLENSDIISIHAPLNSATKNLFDHSELLMLKDEAVLLNLGRGGIVNEESLARIMDIKNLYVGLDVLEKEPIEENHPLLHVKNRDRLYITPHIAWTSIEARERLIEATIENIASLG